MDKLKYIKLENEDGSYSSSIPLAVDSDHVDVDGTNLTTVLNTKADNSDISDLSADLETQKSRIDNLAHLEEGSTTGDAELIDARVDKDGIVYDSLGEAIRETEKQLVYRRDLGEPIDVSFDIHGYINWTNGTVTATDNARCSDFISLTNVKMIEWKTRLGEAGCEIAFYDGSKNFLQSLSVKGIDVDKDHVATITLNSTYSEAKFLRFSDYRASQTGLYATDYCYLITESPFNLVELTNSVVKYKDYFKTEEIDMNIHAYFNNENHTIASTDNARCTDYIEVNPFMLLEYGSQITTVGYAVAMFDKDKKCLDDLCIAGTGLAPNNFLRGIIDFSLEQYKDVKYVVISAYKMGNNLDFTYDYVKKYSLIDYDKLNDREFQKYVISYTNEGYINNEGQISQTENGRYSDYIEIPSKNFKIKYVSWLNSAGAELTFYDKDKNRLSPLTILGNQSTDEKVVDLSEDQYGKARFFRYSIYINNQYGIQGYCHLIGKYYTEIPEIPEPVIPNVLDNANVLIFGDSITDCVSITVDENDRTSRYVWNNPSNSYTDKSGTLIRYNMWPKILHDAYSCKEIRNYAKFGASWKSSSRDTGLERQNLSYQIDIALNDIDNPNNVFNQSHFEPDIIIFALGINDGNANDTYESAMEKTVMKSGSNAIIDIDATIANLDMTKFTESVRASLLRVRKAFPHAMGFVVLPLQVYNNDRNESSGAQLEKMAKRCGFIVINGSAEAGIIRELEDGTNNGANLKDGLHPNNYGQNMMARMIISNLQRNYIPYTNGWNEL